MRVFRLAAALAMVAIAAPAAAQLKPRVPLRPPQDRYWISVDVGQQTTENPLSERQNFEQYFEQGSFTLERTIPRAVFYNVAGFARVWRSLLAGGAVSIFDNRGSGTLTARVPHPLHFNRPRTVEGSISGVERREIGQHVSAGWLIPVQSNLDVIAFGGPSIFTTEQIFVTALTLSLDKEVFPFDSLAFPGAVTETQRENVIGYHLGGDLRWKLNRHFGVGFLVRYANGRHDFRPSGGSTVEVDTGGLHAGGGLRLVF
jgi:hypothetical protein